MALKNEKISLKIEDLKKYDFNIKDDIGFIFTEFLGITFQDMQAT